jgi:hypothetical protein
MNQFDLLKKSFLKKYNPSFSLEIAAKKAIAAATQHNLTYSKAIGPKEKLTIRSYWANQLQVIGERFRYPVNLDSYETIILEFKIHMNRRFNLEFDSGSKHGSEMRISHSQKSISVYVKHLWCLGVIDEPDICPVDRVILSQTKAKELNDISWGFVNSIEVHRQKFKYITNAASRQRLSVAQWELSSFNP